MPDQNKNGIENLGEWQVFFSLYHVAGTLKFTKIGFKCLTALGMKIILFGNDGKIPPGRV